MTEQEIWVKAWCATISASNCLTTATATKAADICLQAYKERFPEPEPLQVNRRDVNRELFQAANNALRELIWCSGSDDFIQGGKAHEAFASHTRPTIERLTNVLKRVSVVYSHHFDDDGHYVGAPVFDGEINFKGQGLHHP